MRLTVLLTTAALLVACTGSGDSRSNDDSMTPESGTITFSVIDSSGAELGVLEAMDHGNSVHISGTLSALPPGVHGIHLHDVGLCEPPFASAGPHWNPAGREHGTDNPNGPHAGDLGNMEVADDGTVRINITVAGASLKGENALLDDDGTALVIHATADDNRTDPAGNSGARIACGRLR